MTSNPFGFHDLVGLAGVLLILSLHWAVQGKRLSPTASLYSLGNALGAGLILVSLYFDFNWSAVIIEASWVTISLWGFWRNRREKQSVA